MDLTNCILLGLVVAAIVAYFFRTATTTLKGQVAIDPSIHDATRKQAKPLIPPAVEKVPSDWFAIHHVPLAIKVTPKFTTHVKSNSDHHLDSEICSTLWNAQRDILLRLESELEMPQQADLSPHFALAGPANQPAQMLATLLVELEKVLESIAVLLQIPKPLSLWHGRALVLLLPSRKSFDHVVWLTNAGVSASSNGACLQCNDGIVIIPLYATRLGGFGQNLVHEVARAALFCLEGQFKPYPQWIEEGLSRWLVSQIASPADPTTAPEKPYTPPNPDPRSILLPATWNNAKEDPDYLEWLSETSFQIVTWLMAQHRPAILSYLQLTKSNITPNAAWTQTLSLDATGVIDAWTNRNINI